MLIFIYRNKFPSHPEECQGKYISTPGTRSKLSVRAWKRTGMLWGFFKSFFANNLLHFLEHISQVYISFITLPEVQPELCYLLHFFGPRAMATKSWEPLEII